MTSVIWNFPSTCSNFPLELHSKLTKSSLEFSAIAKNVVIKQLLTAAVNRCSGDHIFSIPLGNCGGVATSNFWEISDDEISQGIDEAADHYGVTLSEDDKNSLVNIISKFRGIDISDDQIKGYVSDAYSTLKDMGVTKSDVKNIFEKAIEFIKGMLSRQ